MDKTFETLQQYEAWLRESIGKDNFDSQLYDLLAKLLYERGDFAESADLYMKAYDSGCYKYQKNPKGLENLESMRLRGLIPRGSMANQRLEQIYLQRIAYAKRAELKAGYGAIATFIAYHIWVYASDVTGLLNSFSLFIAGGLAWGAWHFILHSFENDSRE